MILQSTLGMGLFAEIKKMIRTIYLAKYNNYNNKIILDYSQEFFPYKNSINTCEFSNILILKDDIQIYDDLKIYDINFNDSRLFTEFIHCDQQLVTNMKDFYPLIEFRLQHNNKKYNHLLKLNRIFNSFFSINQNIINDVDIFYNINMQDYFVLGIHYRASCVHNCEVKGTSEVNYHLKINEVFKKIDNVIRNKDKFKIFLATDIKSIQDNFIKKYKDNLIFNKNNIYMSNNPTDSIEPHMGFSLVPKNLNDKKFVDFFHKNKPGLNGGIQLILDTLILSKCNYFIPSHSNLSDFVFILNPNIEYSYYTN